MAGEFQVGAITSTHGLKGEVKVFPTTDDPNKFKKITHVILRKDKLERELEIESARYHKNLVIVKFKEFNRIEDVETLRQATLWVDREHAVKLQKNEYYHADLIGLEVFTEEGEKLGEISDILQSAANDTYVIKRKDGKDLLVPAIKDCVKEVDIEKGRMTVHLLEGLLDL